jgi:hypothetical protein
MKLLLTSNGFSNQSIVDALVNFVGKKSEETIKNIQLLTTEVGCSVYFHDDQSAVAVDGNKVEVISEGKFEAPKEIHAT